MDEKNQRKLNLVRFGLTLIPSIGEAFVVAVTCAIVYFMYKFYLDFTS